MAELFNQAIINRHADVVSQMETEAINFIWGYGIHKIARSQIMLPKDQGGLNMWELHTKIVALRATMMMKMLRSSCPEIRLLYQALDTLVPTPSLLPYLIAAPPL